MYVFFYLEGPQAELDEDPGLCASVFRQKGEYHVVHPEQRDEKQSGFGQPPAYIQTHEECVCVCVCHHIYSANLFSLEVTGVIASNTWRPQLLHQDADHIDEDHEVHLHGHN